MRGGFQIGFMKVRKFSGSLAIVSVFGIVKRWAFFVSICDTLIFEIFHFRVFFSRLGKPKKSHLLGIDFIIEHFINAIFVSYLVHNVSMPSRRGFEDERVFRMRLLPLVKLRKPLQLTLLGQKFRYYFSKIIGFEVFFGGKIHKSWILYPNTWAVQTIWIL